MEKGLHQQGEGLTDLFFCTLKFLCFGFPHPAFLVHPHI